jgi:hypothetical protein
LVAGLSEKPIGRFAANEVDPRTKHCPANRVFFRAREQKTRAGAGFDRDLLWFLFLFGKKKKKKKAHQGTNHLANSPNATDEKV